MATAPDRFLPVREVLETLLREQAPKLPVGQGSAVGDLLITPASLIQQSVRDRIRVLQRNASLQNYGVLLEEELNRLASNFLVTRNSGSTASGTQRVIFRDLQDVTINTDAVFLDDAGFRFRPVTTLRVTAADLAANFLTATNEYYVDVTIQSEGVGEDYRADANAISQVQGVVGADRTFNPTALSGGDNVESNSELYARILTSLTNRELVKGDALKAAVQANFSNVTQVVVQGFGDEGMTRDLTQVGVDMVGLFPTAFCEKVNLPLDENGDVLWTYDSGAENTAPLGGFVGAVYDLSSIDYHSITVSTDGGKTQRRVCAQEGMRVRFLDADDPDVLNNEYTITRVEEVPVASGGSNVKILRLDRPLLETNVQTAPVPVASGRPYTLTGVVNYDAFHIGGKVDLYVDSSAVTTKTVTISSVEPVVTGSDVAEIELLTAVENTFGQPLFENGIGFDSPVITITKVEQLDQSSDEVLATLVPDTHYAVVRAGERSKFTQTTNDLLVLRGSETPSVPDGFTGDVDPIPLWIGARIRVTYLTDPTIELVQAYVDDDENRNLTADIKVYAPERVLLDVNLSYSGSIDVDVVRTTISELIDNTGYGASITVNEIVSLLSWLGVTDVVMPVRLQARRDTGLGRATFYESEDRLSASGTELFYPSDPLNITKLE